MNTSRGRGPHPNVTTRRATLFCQLRFADVPLHTSSAMAVGVPTTLWRMDDVVAMIEEWEAQS
jgi:hypothetical protein